MMRSLGEVALAELAAWRAERPVLTRLMLVACWISVCGILGLALGDLIVAWRA